MAKPKKTLKVPSRNYPESAKGKARKVKRKKK